MIIFDLKETELYQALKWEKFFWPSGLLKKLFFWLLIILPPVSFLSKIGSPSGFFLICLAAYIFFSVAKGFFEDLKRPQPKVTLKELIANPRKVNPAYVLSFEAARAILKTLEYAKNKGLDANALFYFLLKDNPKLKFVFSRALLNHKEIKKEFKEKMGVYSEEALEPIVLKAAEIANKKDRQLISSGDLLASLSEKLSLFEKFLIQANLSPKDIERLVLWQESQEEWLEKNKGFWKKKNLYKLGSIGRDWASGYTVLLDQYSVDWTNVIKKRGYEEIIGQEEEIKALERILSQETVNNALLIGSPGVGRKSIIHALSKKIIWGQSTPALNYKRVVELNLPALLAQTVDQEKTENFLEQAFKEIAVSGNTILVIDDLQNLVSSTQRPGTVDITAILAKYLALPSFSMIGISTIPGYYKYIEQEPAFSSLFNKIIVSEISDEETFLVLKNRVPYYERKYKKFIAYQALKNLVNYSIKYIADVPLPKKAVDLLDEVATYSSRYLKTKIILPEHVAKIVAEKTKIPVGEIEQKEKDVLLNLEGLIHQRIINQHEAVGELAEALRRARAEITTKKGPIGSFLFLGPTGVGKTETAKAITEIYFGAEERMVRLDMSEFQEIKDIPRLIGGPNEEGILTTQIKQKPFSLLLLDEIEKTHPNILNLFLQVIDEGHITDGVGRKIDFKNAMIVATSNAGYKIILKALKEKAEWSGVKQQLLDYVFENAIFRPEFINRFDAVVVFRPLSKENLLDIAQLMLNSLKNNLLEKHIELEITQDLKEKIVELGYNPTFGAREMKRVIQDKVENVLAVAFLQGKIKKGDKIKISKDFKIIRRS